MRQVRSRLSALIIWFMVAQLGVAAGIGSAAVNLALGTTTAQAYTGKPDAVEVNANFPVDPKTPQFGGRTEAVAVAPAAGTANRAIFAASSLGGLWQATVNASATGLVSSWKHVDSLPSTQLRDVKILPGDPASAACARGAVSCLVLIVSAVWDSHVGARFGSGIWRSTDSGVTWTDVNNCNPAYKIDVVPGPAGSQTVYVADYCGLMVSHDSGATFNVTGPPAPPGACCSPLNDVKHRGAIVYACGDQGLLRTDTSMTPTTWSRVDPKSPIAMGAATSDPTYGAGKATGVCSLALGPAQQVFVARLTALATVPPEGVCCMPLLEETDNPDVFPPTWHDLSPKPMPQDQEFNGQPAFVTVGPLLNGVGNPDPNKFVVYVGTDDQLVYQVCSSQTVGACPGPPPPVQGQVWSWPPYGNVPHSDPASLSIDSSVNHGCPFMTTGDGGVFITGVTTAWDANKSCSSTPPPSWTAANSGLFALDAMNIAGTVWDQSLPVGTAPHTDVYAGLQDNGLIWSKNSGGGWTRGAFGDIYGLWASAENATATQSDLTYAPGLSNTVDQTPGDPAGPTFEWGAHGFFPPGYRPGDNFAHPGTEADHPGIVDEFAPDLTLSHWVAATADKAPPAAGMADTRKWTLWVTDSSGGSWHQEGPAALPGQPLEVRGVMDTRLGTFRQLTFYVLINLPVISFVGFPPHPVTTLVPTLYKIAAEGGIDPNAALTNISSTFINPRFFSVSAGNPDTIFVDDEGDQNNPPRIVRSTDGGKTWAPQTALTNLIQSGGSCGGTACFSLNGQVQAIDLDFFSSTVIVGTYGAGVFVSPDRGGHWAWVRRSDRVPFVSDAYFDYRTKDIFVSSRGRGVWRIDAAPQSTLTVGTPRAVGPPVGVTSGTTFTLSAIGRRPVASVSWRISPAGSTGTWNSFKGKSTGFQITGGPPVCHPGIPPTCTSPPAPDGTYTIDYFATDSAGTEETPQHMTVTVVNTGPTSSIVISGPQKNTTPVTVGKATILTMAGVAKVPAQMSTLSYRVYGQGSTPPAYTMVATIGGGTATTVIPPPTGPNGVYLIDYFSTDSLGNVGATQTLKVQLSNALPHGAIVRSGQLLSLATGQSGSTGDVGWTPAGSLVSAGSPVTQLADLGPVDFDTVTEATLQAATYQVGGSLPVHQGDVIGVYTQDGHLAQIRIGSIASTLGVTYFEYADTQPPPANLLCSGTGTVGSNQEFDLQGCVAAGFNDDISWTPSPGPSNPNDFIGTASPSVRMTNLGTVDFGSVTEAQIQAATPDLAVVENAQVGTVIGVYTRDGHYAKVRVDSIGQTLGITFATYRPVHLPPPALALCSKSDTIPNSEGYDFENCFSLSNGDVLWDGTHLSPGNLTGTQPGAPNALSPGVDELSSMGTVNFESVSLAQLESLQYNRNSITSPAVGTVVAFRTRDGNFGKMRIDSVGADLGVTFVSYVAELCSAQFSAVSPGASLDMEAKCDTVSPGDLVYDPSGLLVPQPGVQVSVLTPQTDYSAVPWEELKTLVYNSNSINLSTLQVGQTVAVHTRDGYYGKLELNSAGPNYAITVDTIQ